MSRRRDHRPRFDTTVCPDPAGCARLFHPELVVGDTCECCGTTIAEPAEWEPVHDPADGRRVLYYRFTRKGSRALGAVTRVPEGWRALRYAERARGHWLGKHTELGTFPTPLAARRAVEAAVADQ